MKERGQGSPDQQSTAQRNVNLKEQTEKAPRDLRAQLEKLSNIFDAEITLLPDGTLHVLDGHFLSRISTWGELGQEDLDLKVSQIPGHSDKKKSNQSA